MWPELSSPLLPSTSLPLPGPRFPCLLVRGLMEQISALLEYSSLCLSVHSASALAGHDGIPVRGATAGQPRLLGGRCLR